MGIDRKLYLPLNKVSKVFTLVPGYESALKQKRQSQLTVKIITKDSQCWHYTCGISTIAMKVELCASVPKLIVG
jgi:hypothetical protein